MRPLYFLVAAILLALTHPAQAMRASEPSSFRTASASPSQKIGKEIHWRCWYNQREHILCLLEKAIDSAQAQTSHSSRLPALSQAIYNQPRRLGKALVKIPLLAPPMDFELVATLADFSVCGNRTDCSVTFTESLPEKEELMSILARQGNLIQATAEDLEAGETPSHQSRATRTANTPRIGQLAFAHH